MGEKRISKRDSNRINNKVTRGSRVAQSVEHDWWSQSREFEPHVGHKAYYKKHTNKNPAKSQIPSKNINRKAEGD